MKKQAELEKKGGEDKDAKAKEDENTPLSGPTIGRRRDFSSKQTASGSSNEKGGSDGSGGATKAKTQQDKMSAFSIGEEFGLDAPSKLPAESARRPLEVPVSPQPKQKDALMEALMDLDDDGLDDDVGEIVFEGGDDESPAEEAAIPEVPSLAAAVETDSGDNNAQSDAMAAPTATAEASAANNETETGSDSNDAPVEDKTSDIPTEVTSGVQEEFDLDTDGLPVIEGLGDELGDLNMDDAADDLGDVGDFDDLDGFDDDEDLEDLENFLTKVSTK